MEGEGARQRGLEPTDNPYDAGLSGRYWDGSVQPRSKQPTPVQPAPRKERMIWSADLLLAGRQRPYRFPTAEWSTPGP
jgi:hypothetical protein